MRWVYFGEPRFQSWRDWNEPPLSHFRLICSEVDDSSIAFYLAPVEGFFVAIVSRVDFFAANGRKSSDDNPIEITISIFLWADSPLFEGNFVMFG